MSKAVAESTAKDVGVNTERFLELADKVIGFANHSSLEMRKDAVALAFLYGTARYGVFTWQNSPKKVDEEGFIAQMLKRYEAMLREQLGDTRLVNRPKSF